jgi:cobalt-zinc-cadmium efflux system outer membrane protein
MAFFCILLFKGKPPKGVTSFTVVPRFSKCFRLPFSIVMAVLAWILTVGIPLWNIPATSVWAKSPSVSTTPPSTTSVLPAITVDQAIRLALARNPELARERARMARNQARSVEAGELPDPMFVVGEQYFPIDFKMGESALTMTTVGLRQEFSPWGKRSLLRQSAVTEEKASRWDLEDKKVLLVRDIRLAWLDLYRTGRTEVLLRSIGSLWEKAFQAALARYRQGIGSESDVLLAQFQKDEIRDKQERLGIQEEESLHRLMRLMRVSRPFRISLEEPHFPDPLPESVLLARLNTHPALKSQKEKDTAQEFRVRSAQKDKIPAVSVEGDYSYFMGPNLITTTPNLFSVLLTFNLPVRPGERQDQRVAEEEQELEILKTDREATRQRLIEKIRDSEGAYRHLIRRTVLLDRVLLPEAKRNVDAALAGYATRTLEMGRVLSAMNKVEKIGIRTVAVSIDRMKTVAELSYLAGVLQGGRYEP